MTSPSQSLKDINVDNFYSGFGLEIKLFIRTSINLRLPYTFREKIVSKKFFLTAIKISC